MRIAYICQYFVPEIGAPPARVSELSREWADAGHDVIVVTGLPNHPTGIVPPEYRGTIFRRERLGRVAVWRNWLYATPNEGFLKKTLCHVSFMASVLALSGPRLRDRDVLIVSSPSFFVAISTFLISRFWRIPYVFEVRDLWPGIFVELGVLRNPALIAILEGLELFLYRRAAAVVPVTDAFGEDITRRGIPSARVAVITNGVDGGRFDPALKGDAVRAAHGFGDRFIVLYIGAHGISHALSAVLDAAEMNRQDADTLFVFVGEGAEKAMLERKAAERGLTNVVFLPGQPRDAVPEWYALADVVLVPLRNVPLFETFIPSKMFEIMAAGRPIVASVKGEARRILERSGGAIIVDPEDAAAIVAAIRQLKADPGLRSALSSSGRRFVLEHYDRAALARQYADVLERATRRQGP